MTNWRSIIKNCQQRESKTCILQCQPVTMHASLMDSNKLITTSKIVALISFLGGTIIFVLFYLTNLLDYAGNGIIYAGIVGVINIAVLILLFVQSRRDKLKRKILVRSCTLLLLNIPIAVLYCWFASILLNTMRITFQNSTTSQLTDIRVYGCEEKRISKLLPGQKKTIWINIPNDCGIYIDYKLNGHIKRELVVGYTSTGSGNLLNHGIGLSKTMND